MRSYWEAKVRETGQATLDFSSFFFSFRDAADYRFFPESNAG